MSLAYLSCAACSICLAVRLELGPLKALRQPKDKGHPWSTPAHWTIAWRVDRQATKKLGFGSGGANETGFFVVKPGQGSRFLTRSQLFVMRKLSSMLRTICSKRGSDTVNVNLSGGTAGRAEISNMPTTARGVADCPSR
jgi:hypothetical protein